MVRRTLAFAAAIAVTALLVAVPAMAQVTGYETPAPEPTFVETEFPSESEPPPTEPPGPPPSESEPPPTVPPGPPPSDPPPPDEPPNEPPPPELPAPELPATGLQLTNGVAAAGAFLLGGTGLVLASRRRRRPQD